MSEYRNKDRKDWFTEVKTVKAVLEELDEPCKKYKGFVHSEFRSFSEPLKLFEYIIYLTFPQIVPFSKKKDQQNFFRYIRQLNYDVFSCTMYTDKSFSILKTNLKTNKKTSLY